MTEERRFSTIRSSTENESLGAGAASGAALGAVIALGVASTTTVIMPVVVGAVAGAIGGAALGRLANTYITRSSDDRERDKTSTS
jgi:outer membrane lipoprotein SlyB